MKLRLLIGEWLEAIVLNFPTVLCVLSYLCAIIIANGAVSAFGQAALPFTAFILIPFDLVARDILHERWKGGALWRKMLLLIVTGSFLSYISSVATARVSIASAIAFLCTGLVDTYVYYLLDKLHRFWKINCSNLASASVDSILFPLIAFGALIPSLSVAQTFSKFAGGFIWGALFLLVLKRNTNEHHYT